MKQLRALIVPALYVFAAAAPVSIAALNIASSVLLTVWILAATPEERALAAKASLPLLPWALALVLGFAFSPTPRPDGLRQLWSLAPLPLLATYIGRVDPFRLLSVYALAFLVAGAMGVVQFTAGTLLPAHTPLAPIAGWRAKGFFTHALTFGAVCMFTTLALAHLVQHVKGRRGRFLTAILGISLVVLALTRARNAWIGFMAAVPIVLWHNRKAMHWAMLIALVGGVAFFSTPLLRERAFSLAQLDTTPTTSTGTRLFLWKDALAQFSERPLFGWGPRTFEDNMNARHPDVPLMTRVHAHNNVLHVLAELGAVGLLGMLGTFGWLLYRLWQSPAGPWRRIAFAVWVSFLTAGLFEWNFGDAEVVMNLSMWTALAMGAARPATEKNLAFSPALD